MYELPLELAKRIQKVMMQRRNVNWSEQDDDFFKKLFRDTAKDRKLASEKKNYHLDNFS